MMTSGMLTKICNGGWHDILQLNNKLYGPKSHKCTRALKEQIVIFRGTLREPQEKIEPDVFISIY